MYFNADASRVVLRSICFDTASVNRIPRMASAVLIGNDSNKRVLKSMRCGNSRVNRISPPPVPNSIHRLPKVFSEEALPDFNSQDIEEPA